MCKEYVDVGRERIMNEFPLFTITCLPTPVTCMVRSSLTFFSYIRYILHRMEGEGDEECPEALARGGVYVICPICIEKKREEEAYLKICCGQEICKGCSVNNQDTCARRSLEFTCPYCRALVLDRKGNKRLLIKHGENGVLVNMTDM